MTSSITRWLHILPFLILVVAACALILVWDKIPDTWPSHWGFNGEPDHWTTKSVAGVFLPLMIGGIVLFVLEVIAYAAENSDDPNPDSKTSTEAVKILHEANANVARLVSCALALLFGVIAVILPLASPKDPWLIIGSAVVLIGGAIWYGVRHMNHQVHLLRREGHVVDHSGWKGVIYYNPSDSRLWVPKLYGLGLTVNFAHRSAWWIMLLLVGVPILIVVLSAILAP